MPSPLKPNTNSPIQLPTQDACELASVFSYDLFADVDSNITAWLPEKVHATPNTTILSHQLTEPLNNEELVSACGGIENIIQQHIFAPQQIRFLIEQSTQRAEILQRNGYQNLFFVSNTDSKDIYLLGGVFDTSVDAWVPYIYRLRNLYRAWSRENRLFLCTTELQQ